LRFNLKGTLVYELFNFVLQASTHAYRLGLVDYAILRKIGTNGRIRKLENINIL